MKQHRLYKREMTLLEELGRVIDKIPDVIVYGTVMVLTVIAVVVALV